MRCECRIFTTTTNLSQIILPLNTCDKTRNHWFVSFHTFEGFELLLCIEAGIHYQVTKEICGLYRRKTFWIQI